MILWSDLTSLLYMQKHTQAILLVVHLSIYLFLLFIVQRHTKVLCQPTVSLMFYLLCQQSSRRAQWCAGILKVNYDEEVAHFNSLWLCRNLMLSHRRWQKGINDTVRERTSVHLSALHSNSPVCSSQQHKAFLSERNILIAINGEFTRRHSWLKNLV